jgi:hypothetical protein
MAISVRRGEMDQNWTGSIRMQELSRTNDLGYSLSEWRANASFAFERCVVAVSWAAHSLPRSWGALPQRLEANLILVRGQLAFCKTLIEDLLRRGPRTCPARLSLNPPTLLCCEGSLGF